MENEFKTLRQLNNIAKEIIEKRKNDRKEEVVRRIKDLEEAIVDSIVKGYRSISHVIPEDIAEEVKEHFRKIGTRVELDELNSIGDSNLCINIHTPETPWYK
jgi:hypothetical protein